MTTTYRNIRDNGILKVNDAAARILLLPSNGDVVEQLDDNSLWAWHQATDSWVALITPLSGIAISGAVGGGVANAALFIDSVGALNQDPLYYVYDASTHSLGIGTNSPSSNLEVVGSANINKVIATDVTSSIINGDLSIVPLGVTLSGAFTSVYNSATGHQSFSGVGDGTAFGYSTEALVNAHLDNDGSVCLFTADMSGGEPCFFLQNYIAAAPTAGMKLIQSNTAHTIGDNGGTPFFTIKDTGNSIFFLPIQDNALIETIDTNSRYLYDVVGIKSGDWGSRQLNDTTLVNSLDWQTRQALDTIAVASIKWGDRELSDSAAAPTVKWGANELWSSAGTKVLSWIAQQTYDILNVESLDWNLRKLSDITAVKSLDWTNRQTFDNTAVQSIDWNSRQFNDVTGLISGEWGNRKLKNSLGNATIDWELGILNDNGPVPSIDWISRNLMLGGNNILSWGNPSYLTIQNIQQFSVTGQANGTVLEFNDGHSVLNFGASAFIFSGFTFVGTGNNDIIETGIYSGPPSVPFSITITDINNLIVDFVYSVGPVFAPGDIVTSSSGGTGTVVTSDGISSIVLTGVIGTFLPADTITGLPSGASGTINLTTNTDLYTWNDGGPPVVNYPTALPGVFGIYGITITFGTAIGHQPGDNWAYNWVDGIGYGLSINIGNKLYKLGDIDNTSNGTSLSIDDIAKLSTFKHDVYINGNTLTIGSTTYTDDGAGSSYINNGSGSNLAFDVAGTVYLQDASSTGISLVGDGNVNIDQKVTKYNGAATEGQGLVPIRTYLEYSFNGSSTNVIFSAAKNVTYRASVYIYPTATPLAGTTIQMDCQFTDPIGAKVGAMVHPTFIGVGSAENASGTFTFRSGGGGNVQFMSTCVPNLGKYKAYAIIEELS